MKCLYIDTIDGRLAAAIVNAWSQLKENDDEFGRLFEPAEPKGVTEIEKITNREKLFVVTGTMEESVDLFGLRASCAGVKNITIITNCDEKKSLSLIAWEMLYHGKFIPCIVMLLNDYITGLNDYGNKGKSIHTGLGAEDTKPEGEIWEKLLGSNIRVGSEFDMTKHICEVERNGIVIERYLENNCKCINELPEGVCNG